MNTTNQTGEVLGIMGEEIGNLVVPRLTCFRNVLVVFILITNLVQNECPDILLI